MADVDLTALTDAGAFVSHEHQDHLTAAIGIADPEVDPGAGVLRFTDREGVRREVRAHFVGTASPADSTWLWSWRNINDFPEAFVRTSERVRALGERYGIAELTTATLPADDRTPLALLAAVKAITGVTAHAAVPTGNGDTVAWLLLDDDALALPEPTAARAVGVITSALADGTAQDHRRALRAWAEQRGAGFEEVDEDVVQLGLTDGDLQVRFDGSARIAGVGRRLRPAPRPGPGPSPVPVEREPMPAEEPAEAVEEPVRQQRSGTLPPPFDALDEIADEPWPEERTEERRTWRDRVRELFG